MKTSAITTRLRLAVLLTGITFLTTGLFWITGELVFNETDTIRSAPAWLIYLMTAGFDAGEGIRIAYTLVFLGLIILGQWLFLRPRGGWRVQLAGSGRPMKAALVTAAFLAMLLTAGLILTLLEVFDADITGKIFDGLDDSDKGTVPLIGFYLACLLVWLLWTVIFFVYWKQDRQTTGTGRIVAALLAGSILELFVAIGVYAWNPNEEDCWCARGSYTGLVFGATVMIWAFGPGLILLFLKKQKDRELKKNTL